MSVVGAMDNTAVIRFGRCWPLLAGTLLLSAVVAAHEVPAEQRIEMVMQRQGDRLVVRMRVPAALLGDAPIQIAAADAARNLDVRQDDAPLAAPALSAVTGTDRVWTDIELTYRVDANANGISARLNGFRTLPMQPVRTTVTYVATNGRAQVLSIVGPARVDFDPGALATVQEFLARALRSVLTLGNHLLLIACLLMPLVKLADDTPQASRAVENRLGRFVMGPIVEFDQDVLEARVFDLGQNGVEIERKTSFFEAAISLKQFAGGGRCQIVIANIGECSGSELGVEAEDFEELGFVSG